MLRPAHVECLQVQRRYTCGHQFQRNILFPIATWLALTVCALDCGIYILREGTCLAHAALCCRGPRVAAWFELREYGPLQVVTASSLVEQTTPTTIALVDECPGILLMLETQVPNILSYRGP